MKKVNRIAKSYKKCSRRRIIYFLSNGYYYFLVKIIEFLCLLTNHHSKFKIDKIIILCPNEREELSDTDVLTDGPIYTNISFIITIINK